MMKLRISKPQWGFKCSPTQSINVSLGDSVELPWEFRCSSHNGCAIRSQKSLRVFGAFLGSLYISPGKTLGWMSCVAMILVMHWDFMIMVPIKWEFWALSWFDGGYRWRWQTITWRQFVEMCVCWSIICGREVIWQGQRYVLVGKQSEGSRLTSKAFIDQHMKKGMSFAPWNIWPSLLVIIDIISICWPRFWLFNM